MHRHRFPMIATKSSSPLLLSTLEPKIVSDLFFATTTNPVHFCCYAVLWTVDLRISVPPTIEKGDQPLRACLNLKRTGAQQVFPYMISWMTVGGTHGQTQHFFSDFGLSPPVTRGTSPFVTIPKTRFHQNDFERILLKFAEIPDPRGAWVPAKLKVMIDQQLTKAIKIFWKYFNLSAAAVKFDPNKIPTKGEISYSTNRVYLHEHLGKAKMRQVLLDPAQGVKAHSHSAPPATEVAPGSNRCPYIMPQAAHSLLITRFTSSSLQRKEKTQLLLFRCAGASRVSVQRFGKVYQRFGKVYQRCDNQQNSVVKTYFSRLLQSPWPGVGETTKATSNLADSQLQAINEIRTSLKNRLAMYRNQMMKSLSHDTGSLVPLLLRGRMLNGLLHKDNPFHSVAVNGRHPLDENRLIGEDEEDALMSSVPDSFADLTDAHFPLFITYGSVWTPDSWKISTHHLQFNEIMGILKGSENAGKSEKGYLTFEQVRQFFAGFDSLVPENGFRVNEVNKTLSIHIDRLPKIHEVYVDEGGQNKGTCCSSDDNIKPQCFAFDENWCKTHQLGTPKYRPARHGCTDNRDRSLQTKSAKRSQLSCRSKIAGKVETAASLYQELGRLEDAAPCFEKSQNYAEAAQICQQLGRHQEAVESFRRANLFLEALRCADISGCLSEKEISRMAQVAIIFYESDPTSRKEAITYLSDNEAMKFFESLGMFDELIQLYLDRSRHAEVAQLFASRAAQRFAFKIVPVNLRHRGWTTAIAVAVRTEVERWMED
ncbi:hypothetical protein BJ742DRAFT_896777 [Cladochytrium replicatum]|nr:hypothetical protein BJ742DRAFT_896777 [Cladochytrium replicatum]